MAVKVPVCSFGKLRGADIGLGPEIKFTGAVPGIARTFHEALYKRFLGGGQTVRSVLLLWQGHEMPVMDYGDPVGPGKGKTDDMPAACRMVFPGGALETEV